MRHDSTMPISATPNRRQFFQVALAGGLTVGLGRWPTATASEPVRRNGKSHLKLSLAAYSYRDLLTKKENPMHLDDFVRLCADLDLDGTELTSYYFPKDFTTDYLIHLKQLTFRLGLDISGTAIANDFCLPPGPKRDETLAHTRLWIDHAALMGAPVIRIFAGGVPQGDLEAAAIERCSAGINTSLEYAAKKGVCLALENHGGITSTPDQMLKIIAGVNESVWFGVNLDAGNFRTADPYADLARIAPYAINVQVKTDISREGKPEETDLARVVKILRDAHYRGYVVLEYESKEDPQTAVPRHLQTLRKLISDAR
ncbi:MAG: sugar phosphate isomerase/epimerase family protein [Planctomycetales bacterium]